MSLPNFRKTVKIKFWSLRNGVGASLGVIHDIDTLVERECYRVRDGDDWRWQIKALNNIGRYDRSAYTDQDTLEAYASELEFEYSS
jgi:hypothetical protein